MKYYIYRHIRLDKNIPFYVGIGHNKDNDFLYKRAYTKHRKSEIWNNIVNKTNYVVEIILDELNKNQAIEKEIEFIKLYGRINKNGGYLSNLTDGGEGTVNYKHSEESKIKNRVSHLGKTTSKETRKKMSKSHLLNKIAIKNLIERNKKITPSSFSIEHKKKISKSLKGKKHSIQRIKNISEIRSKKPIIQYDLNEKFIKEWKSAAEIKRVLGYSNGNIARACTNRNKIIRNRKKRTAYNFYWKYKITTA